MGSSSNPDVADKGGVDIGGGAIAEIHTSIHRVKYYLNSFASMLTDLKNNPQSKEFGLLKTFSKDLLKEVAMAIEQLDENSMNLNPDTRKQYAYLKTIEKRLPIMVSGVESAYGNKNPQQLQVILNSYIDDMEKALITLENMKTEPTALNQFEETGRIAKTVKK